MRSVSISDLKARLAEHLRRVKDGERIVVTEHGRPVAELGPVVLSDDERLADLARRGLIRLPGKRPTKEFWDEFFSLPRPADPDGLVLKALLEDREEGW